MPKDLQEDDAQARSRARASWPVRRFSLGDEPGDNLAGSTTAVERLAMVEVLTLEAWAFSGQPLPSYERANTPVRVVALGGPHD